MPFFNSQNQNVLTPTMQPPQSPPLPEWQQMGGDEGQGLQQGIATGGNFLVNALKKYMQGNQGLAQTVHSD